MRCFSVPIPAHRVSAPSPGGDLGKIPQPRLVAVPPQTPLFPPPAGACLSATRADTTKANKRINDAIIFFPDFSTSLLLFPPLQLPGGPGAGWGVWGGGTPTSFPSRNVLGFLLGFLNNFLSIACCGGAAGPTFHLSPRPRSVRLWGWLQVYLMFYFKKNNAEQDKNPPNYLKRGKSPEKPPPRHLCSPITP